MARDSLCSGKYGLQNRPWSAWLGWGWWFLLIFGIVAIVIGVVVLVWPSQTRYRSSAYCSASTYWSAA